jgi:Zn-dependent peptidase ImmA (M78 family)
VSRAVLVHPEIEECVNRILRFSGSPRLSNGYGIDVETIIKKYCDIELASIPGLRLGGRAVLGAFVRELRIILVEHLCNPNRTRFSLAHELGHSQLEDNYGVADSLFPIEPQGAFCCDAADTRFDKGGERSSGRRHRAEVRANQFASMLLMPEGLVREAWRKVRDESRCADLLGVSREALGYRMSTIGICISDQQRPLEPRIV